MRKKIFHSPVIIFCGMIFGLLFYDFSNAGIGFLYIHDSSRISGSTDTDTCYSYAENTIRPALDHWLSFYTDYDIADKSGIGDYISLDSLCRFDGIIIAPFMAALIDSDFQDSIAAAVEDSGVGLINCDPRIFDFEPSLFDLIPIHYHDGAGTEDTLYINNEYSVLYFREDTLRNCEPTHWINRPGYIGEQIYMFDKNLVSERYYVIDSIASPTGFVGPYEHPDIEPIIVRRQRIGSDGNAGNTPLIMAGCSPSGKGRVWTLCAPPDWWSSPLDNTADGYARHGTMSDALWRGLAYVVRGGVPLKVTGRYISYVWNDQPPAAIYPPHPDTLEFLRFQTAQSIVNRNIPVTFGIFSHPTGSGYTGSELDFLRYLQDDMGCHFMLRGIAEAESSYYWANCDSIDGATAYFTSHTESSAETMADSIETYMRESGLDFDPVISGCIWDLGRETDSFPIYRWLEKMGFNRIAATGPNPLFFLPDSGETGITLTEYRSQAASGWHPEPFGSSSWYQDNLDTLHDMMFGFTALKNDTGSSLILNWWEYGLPDSNRLDSALVLFKNWISGGIEGGAPAVIEHDASAIFDLVNPRKDAMCNAYDPDDSVYWASVRFDSLMGLIDDYARSKGCRWIPLAEAIEKVHNLNRYEITDYYRYENDYFITLEGSTYAATEMTIYHGDPKDEFVITIPPFENRLKMIIRINRGDDGAYAEIY
jgi:hypothetical protein